MKTRLTITPAGAGSFEEGRLRALISAETVDRSSERLLAAGVELDNYLRNPVLLWSHDASLPPIGRAVAVEPEPGVGVWAVNEFAPTPFAQEIAGLYRDGFLNAFSVGFRPLELDTRQRVPGQQGATILRWELVEQSAVAVPANPDALVAAAATGNRAAGWLLKTYYDPPDDDALLRRCGVGEQRDWPAVAAGAVRYFTQGSGLDAAARERAEGLLRKLYEAHRQPFPVVDDRGTVEFRAGEPEILKEREFAALATGLRGRSEALRNLARHRRRDGRPLPALPGLAAAAEHLAEVLDDRDPGVETGLEDVLSELQAALLQLRAERAAAVRAALDTIRRGATAGPRCADSQE